MDNERAASVSIQLFADGIILGPGSDCTVVGNIGLLAVGIVGLSLGVELVLLVAALQTLGEVALAADAGPRLEILAALAPLDLKAGGGVDPNRDVARCADVLVLVGLLGGGREAVPAAPLISVLGHGFLLVLSFPSPLPPLPRTASAILFSLPWWWWSMAVAA